MAAISSVLIALFSGVSTQAQASNPFADCASGNGQDMDHTWYGEFDGMTCHPMMQTIKSVTVTPSSVVVGQQPVHVKVSMTSTLSPSAEWSVQGVVAFYVHAGRTSSTDQSDVPGCSLQSIDSEQPVSQQSDQAGVTTYQISVDYILPATCPSGKYSIATDMSEPSAQGDLANNCGQCGVGDGVLPAVELPMNQFTVTNKLSTKQRAAVSTAAVTPSKSATSSHTSTKSRSTSGASKVSNSPKPCSAAVEQQLLGIAKYIQIDAQEDQLYQGQMEQAQQNIGQDTAMGNYLGANTDRQNVMGYQMKINANNAEDAIKHQQFAVLTSNCVNTLVPTP